MNSINALSDFRKLQVDIAVIKDENSRRESLRALLMHRRELILGYSEKILTSTFQSTTPDSNAMVWFWLNHFNIFWQKASVGAALPDYIEQAIMPNVLADFRSLLLAVLTHPAMLVYLDNDRNRKDDVNENLARELLELHTLGVGGGYSQTDVQEVARVLTGFGLRPLKKVSWPRKLVPYVREKGEFLFDPRRHDFGDKQVLGQKIQGAGYNELETLVDLLVQHPSTARHISFKLGLFLLGENVPNDLVDQAAKVFSETSGNLAEVVAFYKRSKSLSPIAALKTFKDPYRWIISALRMLADGRPLNDAGLPYRWMSALGQPLFGCRTPDGYNLRGSYWLSAGQLTQRFELAMEMVYAMPKLFERKIKAEQILLSSNAKELQSALSPDGRSAFAQAEDDETRLALLISSPEFMYWSP